MKTFVRSILITGILTIVASSSMVAQTSNGWFEQWYRAKYGRPSPTEQARLNIPQGNSALSEATPPPVAAVTNTGFEQWYRAKYGRPSPTEEARLEAMQVDSASPEATPSTVAASADGGFEQRYQAKYGHPSLTGKASLGQIPAKEHLSNHQLNTLIATAKTPADHQRIAQFYQSQAQDYLAQSKEHEAMVAAYKSNPSMTNNKNQASTINHCEYFVQTFKDLAAKPLVLLQRLGTSMCCKALGTTVMQISLGFELSLG